MRYDRTNAVLTNPVHIDPSALYTFPAASAALGLPASCLAREARLGRLRYAKRAGRRWTTGACS